MELYHPRVLELAAEIPHLDRLTAPDATSTKVSRVCGSTVTVDLKLNGDRVADIGVDVQACALGQAATSVLAQHAVGSTVEELRAARDALRAMLKDRAAPPQGKFWELRHLEGVRDYPPRHASTMLAFDAAVEAAEEALARKHA